jgi:hypothetical protein
MATSCPQPGSASTRAVTSLSSVREHDNITGLEVRGRVLEGAEVVTRGVVEAVDRHGALSIGGWPALHNGAPAPLRDSPAFMDASGGSAAARPPTQRHIWRPSLVSADIRGSRRLPRCPIAPQAGREVTRLRAGTTRKRPIASACCTGAATSTQGRGSPWNNSVRRGNTRGFTLLRGCS